MTSQNIQEEKIPSFRKSSIIHGFFGTIEYILILISIFVYVSNVVLLIASIVIISGLIYVLGYGIICKNPYYYIARVGLIFITLFPSAISMIFFIAFTTWSYEPIKVFVIFALAIETVYLFFLLWEISHNKYLHYYHRRHGYAWRGGAVLLASYYSTREFDKLDKGRRYWQDKNPEEVQKMNEELRLFEKKFKKKFLVWFQVLSILVFNIIFGVSLAL